MKTHTLKYLKYIIAILFFSMGISVSVVALFSDYLGLGLKEQFFLYELIGLERRSAFYLGVVLSLPILLIIPIKRIHTHLSNTTLVKRYIYLPVTPISITTYICVLALGACVSFIIKGRYTAFEWTTLQDIPTILRLINPSFLTNDFYTNSSLESPRILFSYIVYAFTKVGISWHTVLYMLKYVAIIVKPLLLFLVMYRIVVMWIPTHVQQKGRSVIVCLLWIVSIGAFYIQKGSNTPFGWGPIQNIYFISPMALSYVVGLLYNIMSFHNTSLKYVSPFVLLLSVLIHPVIGLCHFIVSVIFLMPISCNKHTIIRLGIDACVGVLLPMIVLSIFFKSEYSLDAETFIYHYVNIRHPHHYLMSKAINWKSIAWILLFLIPYYLSFKIKEKKYIVLSSLIFGSFLCAPLIQFLGTEIWKIKEIAILGPSRFTAYTSILWGLHIVIVGTGVYYRYNKAPSEKFVSLKEFVYSHLFIIIQYIWIMSHVVLSVVQRVLIKWKIAIGLLVIFLIGTCVFAHMHPLDFYDKFAHMHPLDFYDEERTKEVVAWISDNTDPDSIFFTRTINSFVVRVYGNRAVFADNTFPFDEKYIEEFTERSLIYKNSKNFGPADYACIHAHYGVDYLIMPSQEKFSHYEPIFSSEKWLVYRMNIFTLEENCDKKSLSVEY